MTLFASASPVAFSQADPSRDQEIRSLLQRTEMHGAIRLSFERESSYFDSLAQTGSKHLTILGHEDNRLACMGRCSIDERHLEGHSGPVGYLAELRLAESARNRLGLLRGGFEHFRERISEDPPDLLFTSIAADNERARRLLEANLRSMPRYAYLGELSTALVTSRSGAPCLPNGYRTTQAGDHECDQVAGFIEEVQRQVPLSSAWTGERLRFHRRLGSLASLAMLWKDDRLVGVAGIWDQRRHRQIVVRGYSHAVSFARPFVNFLGRLVGAPSLPRPGTALSYGSTGPVILDPGHEHVAPAFMACIREQAFGLGLASIAIGQSESDHGRAPILRGLKPRLYRTRLYRVSWPGVCDSAPLHPAGSCLPDLAFL